ncbi:MAG: glycosyltransferase family 1 protein [Rhodanobacter sp.]|nr:MAG: glycosyltransferase family 1 protein [Rhodanobacter sp.]
MKFLLYAQMDQSSIAKELGAADYSYFFLLRAFAEVLSELGEVCLLADPAEADTLHAQCTVRGESCVLLSFTPPHKTPLGLSCPTVPVFAWEYPDIPERIQEACWANDPRHDWRHVFLHTGRAIALSQHTVRAVKRSMGPDYPIVAIAAPLMRQESEERRLPTESEGHPFELEARMADSTRMGLDVNGLVTLDEEDGTPFAPNDWESLPAPLADSSPLDEATGNPASTEDDEGAPFGCGWDIPPPKQVRTRLQGVVYTSVLTPEVGRKNWEDLITAFCWTFRNTADATLLLKLTGADLTRSHHQLLMLLTKLSPFRCRVIALYGYLPDESYAALARATTYYVNTSLCEGLCLPLIEFLGAGVPAIAPDNTAMADYIRDDLAFVVASYPGVPTVWPHGDYEINRTTRHQLDWQSLAEAFRLSHEVARHDPARYRHMSRRAREAMHAYCGPETIKSQLRAFLCPDAVAADDVEDTRQASRTDQVGAPADCVP